jgi:hypothetical protein
MRGDDMPPEAMFSSLSSEARVPQNHLLRPIRKMVHQALAELDGEFRAVYDREGRPSPQSNLVADIVVLDIGSNSKV